jgi:iron complex outermembrane receptor protein
LKFKIALTLLAASSLTPMIAYAADPPPTTDQGAGTVAEIVVTAQGREETLTEVPIAITARTGQQLEDAGVSSTMDLGLVTPGLLFAQTGNSAEPVIRGVGTSLTTPGADANVSLYIDDVYQPNQTANDFQFSDVQNVQVLKGPQGTLFGRNSTGGSIQIKTLDPAFSPMAMATVSYGSYDDIKASAYVTAPITSTLAANLSLFEDHDQGYVYNVVTKSWIAQDKTFAVKGKLLWKPTDNTTFILGANYSDAFNNQPFSNVVNVNNTQNALLATQLGAPYPTNRFDAEQAFNPVIRSISYGINFHAAGDFNFGTLKSVTSFEDVKNYILVDLGYLPIQTESIPIWYEERTFTQEVDFTSKQMGPLSLFGGVYYYYDWYNYNLGINIAIPGLGLVDYQDQLETIATNSESVFAEIHYNFNNQLSLILGGRYSSEGKDQAGCTAAPAVITIAGGPCALVDAIGVPLTPPYRAAARWDAFTPRVVLQYKPDDYSQLYASYSQGFKSGNFNVAVTTPLPPETIDAVELGYKRNEGPFSVDIEGYYYNYSNLQVEQLGSATQLATQESAAKATIYGIDGDFSYRFNENWQLSGGAAWNHSRYNSFEGASLNSATFECVVGGVVTMPTACTGGVGTTFSTGNVQTVVDAKGKELVRAPEYTANATLTYNQPLPVGRLNGDVTVSYNGGFFWDAPNAFHEPSYTIVNATLTWIAPGDKYRIGIWGTNLTNAKYDAWLAPAAGGSPFVPGRPVSAGVSFSVKFQ